MCNGNVTFLPLDLPTLQETLPFKFELHHVQDLYATFSTFASGPIQRRRSPGHDDAAEEMPRSALCLAGAKADLRHDSDSDQEAQPGKGTDGELPSSGCSHICCASCRTCIIEELKELIGQYDRGGTDQFRRRVGSLTSFGPSEEPFYASASVVKKLRFLSIAQAQNHFN